MPVSREPIYKLVSLTFDENPQVRREAAKSLGKLDDPAALFALIELSYDKDQTVKNVALEILQQKKSSEQEIMSFAEIFSTNKKEEELLSSSPESRKQKVLSPITQLFEKKLGRERAEAVKNRMMPTIEKIYQKVTPGKKQEENGRHAIQEFLTSYLEAISDLDHIEGAQLQFENNETQPQIKTMEHEDTVTDALTEIGIKNRDAGMIIGEIERIESHEKTEVEEEHSIENLPQTFFKKAYETMMLSGGDEKIMRREMRRMLHEMERDAKLAFSLAKKRFREIKITNITKIKDGMRNINTDILVAKSVENSGYKKGKEMKQFTRVVVNDEDGTEAVIYFFGNRGMWIKNGMKLKIVKGYAKTFSFSNETVITISDRGNVYIVL